jgi:hypothetical protein
MIGFGYGATSKRCLDGFPSLQQALLSIEYMLPALQTRQIQTKFISQKTRNHETENWSTLRRLLQLRWYRQVVCCSEKSFRQKWETKWLLLS